jgi:hypothetical protein
MKFEFDFSLIGFDELKLSVVCGYSFNNIKNNI